MYAGVMDVTVFIPCLVDQFRPSVAFAAVKLLEGLGFRALPAMGAACCGQPWFKAGYWEESRRLAKRNIVALRRSPAVVVPSGSCTLMIRKHYQELFREEPQWLAGAAELGSRVYELSEFLVNMAGPQDLSAYFPARAAFHDSCQTLRGLGIRKEPRSLLRQVRGLVLVEMERPDKCCGFGGVFSAVFPAVSRRMGSDKLAAARAAGAEVVTSCEISCLLHMERRALEQDAPVRTLHLAEILAAGNS